MNVTFTVHGEPSPELIAALGEMAERLAADFEAGTLPLLHDAEGETCVECGEPIQGDGFRCEGGVTARPGEASQPAPCGQPKHSGECTRRHWARKGLTRARLAEQDRLHERAAYTRDHLHGAARGRGTGL